MFLTFFYLVISNNVIFNKLLDISIKPTIKDLDKIILVNKNKDLTFHKEDSLN